VSGPHRLESLYRATDYLVEAPVGAFVLRIDAPSAALAALHARHGVRCSAFLSACNPASELRDAAENAAAHARLLAALRAAGHVGIEGWGRDPTGAWPAERSVLVPGLPLSGALALARRFGQSAFLHAGADAVPRLQWTAPRDRSSGSPAG
jgi:hypothetical protein